VLLWLLAGLAVYWLINVAGTRRPPAMIGRGIKAAGTPATGGFMQNGILHTVPDGQQCCLSSQQVAFSSGQQAWPPPGVSQQVCAWPGHSGQSPAMATPTTANKAINMYVCMTTENVRGLNT